MSSNQVELRDISISAYANSQKVEENSNGITFGEYCASHLHWNIALTIGGALHKSYDRIRNPVSFAWSMFYFFVIGLYIVLCVFTLMYAIEVMWLAIMIYF